MKKQNSYQNGKIQDGGTCQNFWPLPSQVSSFSTVLQNCKGIGNWNLDRNLIITLLIMAICTVVWQALYNFKTKKSRRQDITNFYLKMFKIMRSLRSAKCLKTRVELQFTTQKANACSSFTGCSVFYWKYVFWVNLVQKQIISFLGKFSPNYQFKLKFCTKTN